MGIHQDCPDEYPGPDKGRSILTMLGIIIGIASVILIISIGNGMRSEINNELAEI